MITYSYLWCHCHLNLTDALTRNKQPVSSVSATSANLRRLDFGLFAICACYVGD